MSITISQTFHTPYNDEGLNKIYHLLFCDDIGLYKNATASSDFPWDVLLADAPDPGKLWVIAMDETMEARQRLLAYRLLAKTDEPAPEKELLGVIIEVGMEAGLDTLAAFSGGTARYINHSGKLLLWETRTETSDAVIAQLFSDSEIVVSQIGKWEEPRLAPPPEGMVRLTFLVSDGLYFGQGPFEVLAKDAMGGPVIQSATALMKYLTEVK